MRAKSKQEFLEQLGYELNRIGIEDNADIFADFEEHFADSARQGLSEEETARRLGDVKEIARSYLNLESSRLNSIVARDVEHKRGVSLTKPGYSVPADLNLLKGRDAVNSDCIRSYTPEHFSEEIYPNMGGSSVAGGNANGAASSAIPFSQNSTAGNANVFTQGGFSSNASASSGASGAAGASAAGTMGGAANGKTVADAFSNAGRAALDAAKVTGQAIADAFEQSNVKGAVVGAGKSAAEAVKAAGQTAADAVKRAKAEHGQRAAEHAARQAQQEQVRRAQQSDVMPNAASSVPGSVPRPNDSFRANSNSSRKGTIPNQSVKAKTSGKPYKLINVSDMQPHLNVGKFIWAVVLDCFLWSWVLCGFAGVIFGGCFGGVIGLIGETFKALFGMGWCREYYFISRIFLTIGFASLVIILFNIGMMLFRLFLKLVRFIINMHIRAIYDL